MNHQYRGRSGPTDVLSFSPVEGGDLGELAFCMEVLKRQALAAGHSLREEILMMLVHGFLHLLGYDHETSERDACRMFRLQAKLLGSN